MTYVAIINTPGYLPDVQPEEFDTCREAWAWLAEECRQRDDAPTPPGKDDLVLVMDEAGEVSGVLPADQGEWLTNVPMDLMANEHIWSLATDEEGAESIALFFREAGLGMDGTGHFTVAGTVYEVRLSETLVTRSNR